MKTALWTIAILLFLHLLLRVFPVTVIQAGGGGMAVNIVAVDGRTLYGRTLDVRVVE